MKVDAARTAKGTLGFIFQSSANSFLGLVLFAVLARFISKSEMGAYAGFNFTVALFQTIGVLGLNIAGPRFVAKLFAEGDRSSASSVAKRILVISIVSAIAVSLAHYLLANSFSFLMAQSNNFTQYFRAASVVVLLFVPMLVVEGLMQGVQEYGKLAYLRIFAQTIRIAVSVWLLLSGWGLIGIIVGWTALGVIILVISILFLSYHLNLRAGPYPLRPILRYSLPMLGAGLVTFLSNSVDIFIVMSHGSPTELGVYNVAATASGALVTILVASASATLLPATSAHYGRQGYDGVEKIFHRSTRYLSLLYTPASFGLASLAWPVIWIMGGSAYQDSILPLVVISISFLAYSLSTPLIISLQAIGETKRVLFVVVGAILIGYLTGSLCFPIFGIIGAALGRACLFAATLLLGAYESRKIFRPRFDFEALWKSILASLFMAITVYFVGSLGLSVVSIPLGIFLGFATYFLMLRVLRAVNHDDIEVLSIVLFSKLGKLSQPLEQLITRLLI